PGAGGDVAIPDPLRQGQGHTVRVPGRPGPSESDLCKENVPRAVKPLEAPTPEHRVAGARTTDSQKTWQLEARDSAGRCRPLVRADSRPWRFAGASVGVNPHKNRAGGRRAGASVSRSSHRCG